MVLLRDVVLNIYWDANCTSGSQRRLFAMRVATISASDTEVSADTAKINQDAQCKEQKQRGKAASEYHQLGYKAADALDSLSMRHSTGGALLRECTARDLPMFAGVEILHSMAAVVY